VRLCEHYFHHPSWMPWMPTIRSWSRRLLFAVSLSEVCPVSMLIFIWSPSRYLRVHLLPVSARKNDSLAPLPPELAPYAPQIAQLIDSVFSDAALPRIDDGRKTKRNSLNQNLEKAEFKAFWEKINRKAAYTVHFDTPELINKCVTILDKELQVTKLQYTVQRGEQSDSILYEALKDGQSFDIKENTTGFIKSSVHSAVKYDGRGSEQLHRCWF